VVPVANVVSKVLNLRDEEFFNADDSVLPPREELLLDLDFIGVAINAPHRIDTGRRDKLPVIMAVRLGGERDWDVQLTENCILVGTNLVDGTVRFTRALVTDKELRSKGGRKKAPRGTKPPASELGEESAQLVELKARERLRIPWETGTWSLGVIYYDWPSNTVVVELEGNAGVKSPPARAVHPQPGPGPLPSYLPSPKTPQAPQDGMAFTVEVTGQEGKRVLNVYGSFAVPAKDFHLSQHPLVHQLPGGRRENVSVVVPVTLAVLGLNWELPIRFDWAVPVYGGQLQKGTTTRGQFAINAFAEGSGSGLSVGSYICYIVMDGRIFGPKAFQIK